MVVFAHLVAGGVLAVLDEAEVVAEVVAAVSANRVSGEVFPAYRTHQYRCGPQGARFIDILAQVFLVGAACRGSAVVGGVCLGVVADALVVCLQFVAVASAALLVVVGKLNEHVVAGLYLLLDRLPVWGFHIEALAAGSVLGTVVHRNVALEELLEHLSPSSRDGGVLVVGGHRGVSDGVNLACVRTQRRACSQSGCRNESQSHFFCFEVIIRLVIFK